MLLSKLLLNTMMLAALTFVTPSKAEAVEPVTDARIMTAIKLLKVKVTLYRRDSDWNHGIAGFRNGDQHSGHQHRCTGFDRGSVGCEERLAMGHVG
jgi:hypothetical protein